MKLFRLATALLLAAAPTLALAAFATFATHSSGGGGGGSIPAGITFIPQDGETITSQTTGTQTHSYYSTWSVAAASYGPYTSGWNSTNFIPMGPFDNHIAASGDVALWQHEGWNTMINGDGGDVVSFYDAAHFYLMQDVPSNPGAVPLTGTGAETPGWFTVDDGVTTYSNIVSAFQAVPSAYSSSGRFYQSNGADGWLYAPLSGSPTLASTGNSTLYSMLQTPISLTGGGTAFSNLSGFDLYAFTGCANNFNGGLTTNTGTHLGDLWSFSFSGVDFTTTQCILGSVYGDEISFMRQSFGQFQSNVSGTPSWTSGHATIAVSPSISTANLHVGDNIQFTNFGGPSLWQGLWTVTSLTGSPITSMVVAMPNNPSTWPGGTETVTYNFTKNTPIMAAIETSGPYMENSILAAYISPPQMNWAAWSSSIHGSRGFLWFDHSFGSLISCDQCMAEAFFQTIQSPNTISMYDQQQSTNGLTNLLATRLNAPIAGGLVTVSPAGYTADNDFIQQQQGGFSGIEVRTTYQSSIGPTGSPSGFTIFADTRLPQSTTSIAATYTINDTTASSVTAIDGVLWTTAACTTGSANITMSSFNPGWVFAGQSVIDVANGNVLGTVSSWSSSSNTLALTGNAAHACSSATAEVEFTRSINTTLGSGVVTFSDPFPNGSFVHIYEINR